MDRFEKIKEIGRGATGTVIKAFDNDKGLLVALKIPDPPPENIDVKTHYKREINLLSGLKHDGIVKVESYNLETSQPWIAYEFIKGHTLRELITSGKEFSVEDSTRFTLELAHALRYLHTQAIVHRDINPNNIMITTDGNVKLMDFGIAHRVGEPFPKQLAGTPGYMSPETAKGEEGGPESDLYSLGLIYYEMLSGKPAYTGESVPEVIGKVIAGDFKPLDQVKSGLNEKIYEIVSRMLATQPGDRYKAMDQLIADFEKYLAGGKDTEESKTVAEPEIAPEEILEHPPKLVGISGPYKGYEFEFGATITTIGRTYSDIDLSMDQEISHQHCWILPEDGKYWLYDAEDSGGTFLGGHPVKKARLIPGDRITLGSTTFKWEHPADRSPSFRDNSEIEYAPLPQVHQSTASASRVRQQVQDHQAPAPPVRVSTFTRVVMFFVVLGIVAVLFVFLNDYFLVPKNESRTILLQLEDYWAEIEPVLTEQEASAILANVNELESDFTYDDLLNIELKSSPFLNMPGPANLRQKNFTRINIVTRTLDVINQLRSSIPVEEKIESVKQANDYLESVELPRLDTWENRRLLINSKLLAIEVYLNSTLAQDSQDDSTPSVSGALGAAIDRFLDGYYLLYESRGSLSVDLARQAYDIFQNSADMANGILDDEGDNASAKIIVILSDYFMVELRVEHLPLQSWTPEVMDTSIEMLVEGRDLLEGMQRTVYETSVPEQISDNSIRVQGRMRAKYINLIDRFENITGADVEND